MEYRYYPVICWKHLPTQIKMLQKTYFSLLLAERQDLPLAGAVFLWDILDMSEALDVSYSGWNAFVTIPSAFDAYASNDLRKDATWEIYPIPHTQIAANPNLKQNPGYSQ